MEQFTFLQERAYSYLRDKIFEDQMDYDTSYSEMQIAKELGCSRTPVKDALTRLRHDKYIDILPSKGFMLHRITPEDILSTFQTRVAVEAFCVINIMKNQETEVGHAVLGRLNDLITEQERFAEKANLDGFLQSDIQFHREIVTSTPNSDFHELFEAHTYRIEKLAAQSLREGNRCKIALQEHQAILKAIAQRSLSACYHAVEMHNQSTYEYDLRILARQHDGKRP